MKNFCILSVVPLTFLLAVIIILAPLVSSLPPSLVKNHQTTWGNSNFEATSPTPPTSIEGQSLKTPDWVKTAVFYQIYPERFRDGNPSNNAWGDGTSGDILWKNPGDWPSTVYAANRTWGEYPYLDPPYGRDWFGGDLQGVEEKASYLADLGITAIWFNPTMDSTDNHGYTVIDYKSVNRYFGINHRDADGTLILDYNASIEVFENMTKALDEYGIRVILDGVFNHCSAKNKWFDRDDDFPTDGAYESQSSQWYSWFNFYDWPNSYETFGGVKNMPALQEVDGFKDYIYRANDSVIKFWNDTGVDGWRLDVGQGLSHGFWQEFRTYYKALNPEGFILGEYWGNAHDWLQGDQWDSVMNYPFRDAVLNWANGGSVTSFDNSLGNIRSWYPEEVFYSLFNILDSHDVDRALSVLGENKTRMKLAVLFQMTYPGVPAVYYGDEVGMSGPGWFEHARQCYPWPDTGGSPDMDMFNHYKTLIGIRKRYPVLSVGSLETRLVDNTKRIYVLVREYNSSVSILVYNNGDTAQTVTVDVSDLIADGSILTDVLNNETYTVSNGNLNVQTKGMWANILLSGVHDVAVTGVTPSNIVVGVGYPVDVAVVAENQGNFTETFNVTLYYGNNVIGTRTVSDLAPQASTTIIFSWNTTNISPGNYTLKAEASVVLGEIYALDNIYIDGIVRVIQAQFTFTNLYTVDLFVNGIFVDGNNLTVRFYSYSGAYQAETTVWSGITPTQIELSENVSHPLGLPIEIVTLVLTYENETIISSITTFIMCRSHLMSRLGDLDHLWTVPGANRPAIMKEYVTIDGQWPYAP